MRLELVSISYNMKLFVVALLALLSAVNGQHDPHWVNGHNTIVHLFEWKWNDIADECERFLAPKGYGGVQVSPVSENAVLFNRPWWERYQPVSYKLITRSGNEEEFASMVRRCNNVGVRIYVDALPNHMAAKQEFQVVGTAGSTCDPGTMDYPAVPYTAADFNTPCIMNDWNSPNNMRDCQLLGLVDIRQSVPSAQDRLVEFLGRLINLGVAGFRFDAAKHMWPQDLKAITNRLPSLPTDHGFSSGSRAFIYQEVIDYGGEAISGSEYFDIGTVTEFRFSQYISQAFRGHNSLSSLQNWGEDWGLYPSRYAFVFVDNHDNQRGHGSGNALTYKDNRNYKMAAAFKLSHPYGVTRIMSSYDFNDGDQGPPEDANHNILSPTINADGSCGNGWICEHRWRPMYGMITFKNVVQGTDLRNWWSNGNNQIAYSRGDKGFVVFNVQEGQDLNQTFQTGLPGGNYCDVITGELTNGGCTGRTINVNSDGSSQISISWSDPEGVVAIHVGAKL